jgi:hypothetical protein
MTGASETVVTGGGFRGFSPIANQTGQSPKTGGALHSALHGRSFFSTRRKIRSGVAGAIKLTLSAIRN